MSHDPTRRGLMTGGAALSVGALAAGTAGATQSGDDRPLAGKTALVTGAARGFGRETAIQLTRQGAALALLDIADPDAMRDRIGYPLGSRAELDETLSRVEAEGGEALAIVADVRDRVAMADAVAQIVDRFGGLDIVIANAGIVVIDDDLDHYDPDRWDALMEVNLYGVMNTVEAALEPLKAAEGARVVIVSSRAARAASGVIGYGVSKWAVTGLMKNLADVLGEHDIAVNCVAPGMADTPMPYYMTGTPLTEEGRAELDARQRERSVLPMGLLDPAHVARVIVAAAGPSMAAISGTTFDVNAGSSASNMD